jgi:epoxyqueuosine reductase
LEISPLPSENRRGLDYAIVFTIPLRHQDELDWPAFDRAEMEGEALAGWLTQELISLGYDAYPHTLKNVFNSKTLCSPLPNKTLAVLAGLGWVGKNTLFISSEYGSAFSIAAVLTSAVLPAQNVNPLASRCGDCTICRDVCAPHAIQGRLWKPGLLREQLLDAPKCTQCFQCLAQCPWTKRHHQR